MACLYEHKQCTQKDLKEGICVEVAQIDRAMLVRMEANFKERPPKCINENKHHMKNIGFVVWRLVPRDFRYRGSIKDAVSLKHERHKKKQRQKSSERTSVSGSIKDTVSRETVAEAETEEL